MNWTTTQKEALKFKGLGKVIYKNMYQSLGQLGYGNKGTNTKYNVVIAKDAPSKDVRDIVTLHEVGHIVFRHLDVDIKQEFKCIKGLCDKFGKSYDLLQTYGGPMNFINIAMDLEVNSKLLTLGNIKTMKAANFPPCTPEGYGIDTLDTFRDYYIALIEKLDPSNKDQQENSDQSSNQNQQGSQGQPDQQGQPDSQPSDLPSLFNSGNSSISELEKQIFGEEYGDNKSAETIETEEDEAISESPSLLAGDGESNELTEVVIATERRIADFIKASIRRPEKEYTNDILKLHNRGTRVNKQGILYSSTRRKNTQKPKFCFILDVSGSMNIEPIMKALGTLGHFFKDASKNSEIFAWDTKLIDRFPVDRIAESVRCGGGTDMASAVEFAKKEGFTDCVVYSDFYTDLEKLDGASKGIGVHSICVDSSDSNPLKDSEFYAKHKHCLFLD